MDAWVDQKALFSAEFQSISRAFPRKLSVQPAQSPFKFTCLSASSLLLTKIHSLPSPTYKMERRKTVANPSQSSLMGSKGELAINTRKSITTFPSYNSEVTSPVDVVCSPKRRNSQSVESAPQLIVSQRPQARPVKSSARPEFSQGFSLFQSLFPLRPLPKSHKSPVSDSFHQDNHLIVAPKGSMSEVNSPANRRTHRTLPDLTMKVNIKTMANGEKRRSGKTRKRTLNVFSWLEEEQLETRPGKISEKTQFTGTSSILKTGAKMRRQPLHGSLPNLLGKATVSLRELPNV